MKMLRIHCRTEIKADIFAAAIRSMQLQFPKVKVSRVLSRDMDSTEDLWLMVLNIIVIRVQMVLAPIRVKYSKEKECLDRWEMRITIQNLEIVKVDVENNNLLLVKGAVQDLKNL